MLEVRERRDAYEDALALELYRKRRGFDLGGDQVERNPPFSSALGDVQLCTAGLPKQRRKPEHVYRADGRVADMHPAPPHGVRLESFAPRDERGGEAVLHRRRVRVDQELRVGWTRRGISRALPLDHDIGAVRSRSDRV